jgi:hypothetical protein
MAGTVVKSDEAGGARVHLTGKEYQVLELLSLRKGTTLTKEMFLNNLYGGMDEPEIKIIDVFICKLRKKLANASNGKDYIEAVWGRGYVLREPSQGRGEDFRLTVPCAAFTVGQERGVPSCYTAMGVVRRADTDPALGRTVAGGGKLSLMSLSALTCPHPLRCPHRIRAP